MDTIIGIFKSLGVDSTVFTQFIIICILYLVLRNLLFGKLQEVLELREGKTTKLEENANKKFIEAENLAKSYKEKINNAQSEAFSKLSKVKEEVLGVEKQKLKAEEAKLNSEIEAKAQQFANEVEQKRQEVLANADALANDLITKLTN
ncbi:ATP synthase B/B' CF(0) [Bacteriovorax sp. BSW11_IV]|uniref:F0F1 ATP synthase subunit B family protein n=1 Tax=Bacteriovorax sp. BSW11_IV TaxID=1353529 RepID=UPI000389DC26|nr:ATP synthase B/B' CF(0) [Bacteriovorax sp. BSW11_IV]EQC50008.1 ATP synthase B/B' CF(0) [Bacteriovorax sp. BSW11_IV]